MADILIRGMEMPLRCINCPFEMFIHGENRCRANRGKPIEFEIGNDRGKNCPIVPLPEGHGRLIDADIVIQTLKRSIDLPYNKRTNVSWSDAFDSFVDRLEEQDVVLEAEGGGEDG
ncbi:MAG: hypothetical protein IKV00_07450 [Clostridia bacterium]|nr:hypothetical protein [Clostridia bacterium]